MSQEIYGPMGELFELGSPLDVSADGGMDLPTLAARFLRDALDSPGNREALRHALWGDPMTPPGPLSDIEMLALLTRRLEDGSLRLRRVREDGEDEARVRRTPFVTGGGGEAQDDEPTPPPDEEVKIKDWILECHHHTTKGRDLIERGSRIMVVPDKGETTDTIKVHWRDDYQGSMPAELDVRIPGRPDTVAAQAGAHPGGYTTYSLEVEYLGDVENNDFISRQFWTDYRRPTTYKILPGPTSVPIDVYSPRQFKFEFKFPPLAAFKTGHKYEANGADEVKALAKEGKLTERYTTQDAYWSPTGKNLQAYNSDTHPDPLFVPSYSEMRLADTISLEVDGAKVELDLFKLIGVILNFVDTARTIIETVKQYQVQVGWYMDWNLQVMQGGISVDWYWKEHTDHRVFQFIDVGIKLTLFALTFEIGIGASACSFKLQVYASLGGEVAVEFGGMLDNPEGDPGVRLPGLKGKITGALGARVEGGYIFDFEAKGETAVEAEVQLGINTRSMVALDGRARWTGITATCKVSAGFWGVGGTKTETWTLCEPSSWWGIEWPKEKAYEPPTMGVDRIRDKISAELAKGWDLLVYSDDKSHQFSHRAVAAFIARKVAEDVEYDCTPDNVEGLTTAVRADLDILSERDWARDWVSQSDLNSYVKGSIRGLSLSRHLENGASPTRRLIAANS